MSASPLNAKSSPESFLSAKHAKYFLRFLQLLPPRLSSHDCTRGTIAFFAVCGLDILNSMHLLDAAMQRSAKEWIYGNLVEPKANEPRRGGFQGTRVITLKRNDGQPLTSVRSYQLGHLAMTYTSISLLATLGDDLSRLNRKSIVDGVAACQQPDGSFSATITGSESDMRFVFCAAAICHMLDYWGDVNKQSMLNYIKNSIRYDGGISQHLQGESHGGTTYCAVAALDLSGQLQCLEESTLENIKRWLLFRQVDGFQGRPNKPVDTCYSFWIGATLKILDAYELIDYEQNRQHILATQDKFVGGFSKWPESGTDPFHTYFGICGLAFMQEPGLAEVMPSLNISMSAYRRLLELHSKWRAESDNEFFATKTNFENY